jgi:hypothetical protein
MMRKPLAVLLCALAPLSIGPAAAQPAAPAPVGMGQGGPEEAYRSYLALPDRTTTMLRDNLDSDDAIGAQVVGLDGTPIGMVTDLLLDDDGRIGHAILDVSSSRGAGSGPVVVEIAQLRRVEDHLMLELTPEQLAALPEYRQVDDRWVSGP